MVTTGRPGAPTAFVVTQTEEDARVLRGHVADATVYPLAAAGNLPDVIRGVRERAAGVILTDELPRPPGSDVRPGDVVVAAEVVTCAGAARCASAGPLVAALRQQGLRVHFRPVDATGALPTDASGSARPPAGPPRVRGRAAELLGVLLPGPTVAVLGRVGDGQIGDEQVGDGQVGDGQVGGGLTGGGHGWSTADLEAVGRACTAWLASFASRRVVLASPRSFCAGVDRAVQIVERALERFGPPVYVRKQIVHNRTVVDRLARRGAVFVETVAQVPPGAVVIYSAHGVSPQVRQDGAERGLTAIDATCPLVSKVHAEARRFADQGRTVIFIGHAGHEETEGTMGEAPQAMRLVERREDVALLDGVDPSLVSYLTQTTLALDETAQIVADLQSRFPRVQGPASDDICYATTNRQAAVRAVAADVDLMLVVGSSTSSNSKRLVEVAGRAGCAAHLIDDASDLVPSWLAAARSVGLTGGASTPEGTIQNVIDALRGLGPVEVEDRSVASEEMIFSLPSLLR
jgi:4-hydroxy-3-methylbut-2-enyl diphosphate reductase